MRRVLEPRSTQQCCCVLARIKTLSQDGGVTATADCCQAMVDKKRGVKAKCANALKASEQQVQDLQRSELQRKEQQLAVLVPIGLGCQCNGHMVPHRILRVGSEGGVAKKEWREQMLVHPELVGKVCGAAVLSDWANKHFAVPCHAQDTSAGHVAT
ncbi:hypothetical protein HaLaN_26254, partial [Haematococcus lacustris]